MNMMDAEMVRQDLTRREECERLYDEMAQISKVSADVDTEWLKRSDQYKSGYAAAMDEVLNTLDGRITWLRDKWS